MTAPAEDHRTERTRLADDLQRLAEIIRNNSLIPLPQIYAAFGARDGTAGSGVARQEVEAMMLVRRGIPRPGELWRSTYGSLRTEGDDGFTTCNHRIRLAVVSRSQDSPAIEDLRENAICFAKANGFCGAHGVDWGPDGDPLDGLHSDLYERGRPLLPGEVARGEGRIGIDLSRTVYVAIRGTVKGLGDYGGDIEEFGPFMTAEELDAALAASPAPAPEGGAG